MKRYETNLDAVMGEKGITKDIELARLMNLPPSTLYARLKGDISMKTLESISDVLDVPVIELLKRESV